jgi:hypothetical protein
MAGIVANLSVANGLAGDRLRHGEGQRPEAISDTIPALNAKQEPPMTPRRFAQVDVFTDAFFPGNNGLCEDPVTGSLNAALAQWLIGAGLAPSSYMASQGTVLDRRGRVHLNQDDAGQVWVGGDSVTCISGTVVMVSDVMASAATPSQR